MKPNFSLEAIEYRIGTLEAFLDFDRNAPADDDWPDSIHNLIAEGISGVTTHCMEHAAALVTVEAAAVDNRIDAIAKQAELLANLLNSVKALVLNIDARLEALESKAPC